MQNKIRWFGALSIAVLAVAPLGVQAVPISSLPDTSLLTSYAELGNYLFENNTTITGNVGVTENGSLKLMAPDTINGNIYVANGATFTSAGTINGSVFTGQNLTAQQSQVFSASSGFAALAPNQTFTTLNSAQNFSAAAGNVTVVNVGTLNLNNANINFSGGGYLVLNVSGSFKLQGSASILTSDPSHVFINYTGTSGFTTMIGDTLDGYTFIPNSSATLDGTYYGGLYGGDDEITLMSGLSLNNVPSNNNVPDAGATALFLSTSCGLLALAKRKFLA